MNKLGWFLTGLYSGCLAGIYIIRELLVKYGDFESVKFMQGILTTRQDFIFRWLLAGLFVVLVLNILIFHDKKSKEDKEVDNLMEGKDEEEIEEDL